MAKQKNSKEIIPKITQLELIQTLLNDAYLQKNDDAKKLVEENVMERKIIVHKDLEYLLYKFDEDTTKLFPFFAMKTSGLKQICDYFLFVEEKKSLHILLIELKEGTESANKQLIAAEYFTDFILASAKRVGIKLTENIFVKKVRISENRANKRTTAGRLTVDYDINKIINYDYADVFRIKEVLDV